MAKAKRDFSAFQSVLLSSLFTDPFVRDAFRRAERDDSMLFAVPPARPRTLDGGAAERVRELELEFA